MQRIQKRVLTVSILLGLVAYSVIWFSDVAGPGVLSRVWLPGSKSWNALNLFDLGALDLTVALLCLALVLVGVTWERGRADRYEPLILLGVLVMVLATLNGVAGCVELKPRFWFPMVRPPKLEAFTVYGFLGSMVILAGLIRVAFNRERRGAFLGACVLMTMLGTLWWVQYFILAPHWIQPGPAYTAEDLPVAPNSYPNFGLKEKNAGAALIEIVTRGTEVRYVIDDEEVAEHELFEQLPSFFEERILPWNRARSGGRPPRVIPLVIRAEVDVSVRSIVTLIESFSIMGVQSFLVITRIPRPWITGSIEVQASVSPDAARLKLSCETEGARTSEPVFRFHGRSASTASEFFAKHDLTPNQMYSDREELVLAIDECAGWQEVVSALDELWCSGRVISLELLNR